MTFEEAMKLDIKDMSGGINQRDWRNGNKSTTRFNTFKQVVEAGINKWKELNLECDFISLYNGDKYTTLKGEKTVVVKWGQEYNNK